MASLLRAIPKNRSELLRQASPKVGSVKATLLNRLGVEHKSDEDDTAGSGSCFFIHPSGLALSSSHVSHPSSWDAKRFRGWERCHKVQFPDQPPLEFTEIYHNRILDYSILKPTYQQRKKFPYFEMATGVDGLEVGEKVYSVGYPMAINPHKPNQVATEGILSAIFESPPLNWPHRHERVLYYRTDTHPTPGYSGGPLFKRDGTFLGVVTNSLVDEEQIFFGCSIKIPIEASAHVLSLETILADGGLAKYLE